MKWKTALVSLLVLPWMWTACQREWLDPKDLKVVVSPGFQFPLAHVALELSFSHNQLHTSLRNLLRAQTRGFSPRISKWNHLAYR
jgi:hypothetical protein